MIHKTHRLKAYTADPNKPLVFCSKCGKEEDEGLEELCSEKFFAKQVDTENKVFHSALPFNT